MILLSTAIIMATKAHDGQVNDKCGEQYILHPLRVMEKMKDDISRIVAVLHDIIEDTNITKEDLAEAGFSQEVIEAVICLTRRKNEDYFSFIRRCKQNNIARFVKLADIEDNMDLRRLSNPTEKDYERNSKYKKASDILLGLAE